MLMATILYAGYQSGNQAFEYNPAASGNAITFAGDPGVSFVQLSNSSKTQSTSNGYEVFENVLSRFKFSVTLVVQQRLIMHL